MPTPARAAMEARAAAIKARLAATLASYLVWILESSKVVSSLCWMAA